MAEQQKSYCRKCGAEIQWAQMQTQTRRVWLPFDMTPVTAIPLPLSLREIPRFMTPEREVIHGVQVGGDAEVEPAVMFRCHFETCPDGDDRSKPE